MFDARVHSFRFYKLFFREFSLCRFELTDKYVRFWSWITKQFAIHHKRGNSYVVLTFVFYVCPELFHSRVWFFLLWCYDVFNFFPVWLSCDLLSMMFKLFVLFFCILVTGLLFLLVDCRVFVAFSEFFEFLYLSMVCCLWP